MSGRRSLQFMPSLRFASTRGPPSSTNTSQMFMARPDAERRVRASGQQQADRREQQGTTITRALLRWKETNTQEGWGGRRCQPGPGRFIDVKCRWRGSRQDGGAGLLSSPSGRGAEGHDEETTGGEPREPRSGTPEHLVVLRRPRNAVARDARRRVQGGRLGWSPIRRPPRGPPCCPLAPEVWLCTWPEEGGPRLI